MVLVCENYEAHREQRIVYGVMSQMRRLGTKTLARAPLGFGRAFHWDCIGRVEFSNARRLRVMIGMINIFD